MTLKRLDSFDLLKANAFQTSWVGVSRNQSADDVAANMWR